MVLCTYQLQAIKDEGENPEEYLFDVAADKTPTKVPLKRSSSKY